MKERIKMISKEVIKIESFDTEQLKRLQEILENNKIKNELLDFDTIEIEYEDKTLELNKEFKLMIKLIRNKYYRKLLNIVDHILKFRLSIDTERPVFGENNYGTGVYEILLKDYVNLNKYKEKLKMELINYIGLYNFDNIFELTKEEMIELEDFKYDPNNHKENIYEAYGMFCYKNDELIKSLEKILSDDRLSKIKETDRFIIICPELIREYCLEQFDKYKSYEIIDESQLFTIIYNKVLTHELGHAVFDYIKDYENEKRANYFASLTFDGTFDNFIELFTEHQDKRYKNPILVTNADTDTIKKVIYHI